MKKLIPLVVSLIVTAGPTMTIRYAVPRLLAACAALLSMGLAGTAHASLIGSDVTFQGLSNTSAFIAADVGPLTATIAAGAEFSVDLDPVDPSRDYRAIIDFGADQLDISLSRNFNLSTPGGYRFKFTGIAYLPTMVLSNTTGANVSFIDLGPDTFTVFLDNLSISGPESISIALAQPNAVPEPTTLALLSIGLAGIGLARRRKA